MIIKFIKKYYEIIILCILGLTPLLWFHGSEVILGHDSGLVISPISHFFDRLYLWTYRFGLGQDQSYALAGFMIHGFEAFVASLNLGLQATQKIVLIFCFLLAFSSTARATSDPKQVPQKADITEYLGGQIDLDLEFLDENSKKISLRSFVSDGKPLIIAPVYFECPRLCTLTQEGLAEALKGVMINFVADFRVV